jgi:RNA polymerase sigma-70 factor (ECF subfamily)
MARDERALADLIDLMSPWLLGITQALLEDPDEAEEVVAESFRAAWVNADRIPEEPRGLLAWMLRVTRNRVIDRLRARGRRRRKAIHLATKGADSVMTAEPYAPNEAAAPGWHVHQVVHEALDALPREQRAVVWMAYFQGLTHAAIAAQLGIPIGTVKTRLRLAFDKLRPVLAPMRDWIA